MTLITAHGGAQGTSRNSKEFFDGLRNGAILADAFEVDIWGKDGCLYLSHLPNFNKNICFKLEDAFELAKEKNLRLNCDIKKSSLFLPTLNLAKKMGVTHLIYFTGATKPRHIKDLDDSEIYANRSFYKMRTNANNPRKIKEYLESLNNPRLKGINVSYAKAGQKFIQECVEIGLPVSVYFADKEEEIKFLLSLGVANITTDYPSIAVKIKNEANEE